MYQLNELRQLISHLLKEGGLKLPPQHRRDLTPPLVKEAAAVYREFLSGFNSWLSKKGKTPIEPIRPTGSSVHAEKDLKERPSATYGDIDYLVSFPVNYSGSDLTERRREEAAAIKEYTELLKEYITIARPPMIDAELTLNGHPLMIIVKVPSGGFAQVDTVITHPAYTEWMKGRYTPERGIKGYVTGNLYKALGDYFILTIGTEGVMARVKDGQRVPSKFRTGITYHSVSTDFKNFFRDIADYVIEGAYVADPLLEQHPGLNPDDVNISELAYGIVGLAKTVERASEIDATEMLTTVYDSFVSGMEENVDRKMSKDITPEQNAKMRKLNIEQAQRVRKIFGV